jgi:quercetin dioxygenase-like cupin family protein
MDQRDGDLANFLQALRAALASGTDDRAAAMVEVVFANLEKVAPRGDTASATIPVCRQLDPALGLAEGAGQGAAPVARSIRPLIPRLTWQVRAGSVPEGQAATEMDPGNTMIFGPGGLEPRSDLWIGMSLLAPGAVYPDHRHPPPEVYLVLTPGQFRQETGDWFTPGPGGVFFNTPGIVHAMRAVPEAPLLAIWLQDTSTIRRD